MTLCINTEASGGKARRLSENALLRKLLVMFKKNNPRNIKYMPVVIFSTIP